MPSYILRQHDNGVWYIHWTDDNRRSKRESTGQKQEVAAQIYLGEWLKGAAQDAAGGPPIYTVEDLWKVYFEKHVEKNCEGVGAAKSCWSNLKAHFGALTLPQVTQKDADGVDKIEEYILLREDGEIGNGPAVSGTIRHELSRMKTCFNWHADPKRKTIGVADIPVFDLPPASPPRTRWLRTEEVQRLMAGAAAHTDLFGDGRLSRVERFLWLALETAARMTAILQLTWDRVDFDMGLIDYRVPGQRETKKRRAVVPMSTSLREVLVRAYKERENDFVCGGTCGSIVYRAVKSVAKRAEIDAVSPHVLRHTAATHMLRNGVPVATVAGILADTIQTVEKTYWHHIPNAGASAVELLAGRMLSTVKPEPETTS